ncbi:Sterol O-acyltransferase 2 [Yarrowia sp. B02]|nr:Sterol O-acyltransferase 2 [Yarrowia sp. B02]
MATLHPDDAAGRQVRRRSRPSTSASRSPSTKRHSIVREHLGEELNLPNGEEINLADVNKNLNAQYAKAEKDSDDEKEKQEESRKSGVDLQQLPDKYSYPRFSKNNRRYRFTDIKFKPTPSILDKFAHKDSEFFGFYTLLWMVFAFCVMRTALLNYTNEGIIFRGQIFAILSKDLWKVALVDLGMYLCTYISVFLQLAVKNGLVDWNSFGWIIQNVHQCLFLFFFLWVSKSNDLPWIGNIFIVLHAFVMLMKQHSYAFYNGYLWTVEDELSHAKQRLTEDIPEKEKEDIKLDIDFCETELKVQSRHTPFPTNITFSNYFWYSMFPTLVYEIEFPRTPHIKWRYVLEKAAAVFGVFFLMIWVAESYLYPPVVAVIQMRDEPFWNKVRIYPIFLSDILLPFVIEYMLVFYIIWDAILNGIAELTRFADRDFYGPWWNCTTWEQFSREWNIPVYQFLKRHVYHSSISAFQFSKGAATLTTFLLSSLVHELVMFAIFKKFRGYLLLLQMTQLPLAMLQRTKWIQDRPVFGNAFFWFSLMIGPSLMCSMYLLF